MDSLTSSVLKYFQSSKENDALSLILYNQISIIIVGGGGGGGGGYECNTLLSLNEFLPFKPCWWAKSIIRLGRTGFKMSIAT